MGLLDLTSEVLTEYKADASQHKRELQELKNFQHALGEEEGRVAAERNQHLTEWIEKLGKITLAFVAVKEIGEVVWDGYKEGIKDARLATQAHGVDLEKLTEATRGLVSENQLLEFAAKANRSAFHNSQEDIENAAKAMIALEHRGASAAEAQEAITRALVEGKTKGLEPYGIVVDKHIEDLRALGEENLTLAQKTEIHTKAMESLKTVADEVSDSQDDVGDSMQRTQVKLANAWDDVKKDLGKLVIAFQPLIEALAKVLGLVSKIAEAAGHEIGGDVGSMYSKNSLLGLNNMGAAFAMAQSGAGGDLLREQQAMNRFGSIAQDLGQRFQSYYVDASTIDIDKYEWKRDEAAEKKAAEAALQLAAMQILRSAADDASFKGLSAFDSGSSKFRTNIATGSASGTNPYGASAIGNPFGVASGAFDPGAGVGAALDYQAKLLAFKERTGVGEEGLSHGQIEMIQAGQMKDVLQYAQEFLNQKHDNVFEKIFGKVDEINVYRDAFSSLKDGIVSGYEAMVKGNESFGAAFQKSVAQALLAEGSKMQILALENAAWALADLAVGNFAGAAHHGAAAAGFEAGAIAAGFAANALGVGGGGGSSSGKSGGASAGGGSSSSSGSSGGSSGGRGGGPIIVYGDSFADDSPRMRQLKAKKLIDLALGSSAGDFS